MDCNKCKSKEYCEHRKDGQRCPYQGLGMDNFFLNWDGTSGNLQIMKQYIPKSALVAEIEKLINEIYAGRPFDSLSSEQQTSLWYVKSIMSSINTLEVKEVDLDKEIDLVEDKYYGFESLSRADIIDIAKHFYELGLKTQKGE